MDKHRIGTLVKSWFTGFDKPLALVVFGVTLSLSSYAITVLRAATHER